MISALNDGRPGAASVCWMCRRICVGGKNGCSCDSRDSGCERSITRRGMPTPFRPGLCRPGRCGGSTRGDHPLAASRDCARVASPTTPDGVMSRSMSIGTTTPGPARAHARSGRTTSTAARVASRRRRGPRRRASPGPRRRAGRAPARARSPPPPRGSSAPRPRRARRARGPTTATRKTRRPVVSK